MANLDRDLILVSGSDVQPWMAESTVTMAMESAGERVDGRFERLVSTDSELGSRESVSDDSLSMALNDHGTSHRIVLLALGGKLLTPWEIRSAAWFSQLDLETELYLSHPPSPKEYGEWIGSAAISTRNSLDRILLLPPPHAEDAVVERIVCAAYWAQTVTSEIEIICHRPGVVSEAESGCTGYLPWSNHPYLVADGVEIRGAARGSVHGMVSWDWLPPSVLAGWMVRRFLDAVRGRPFPIWSQEPEWDDIAWPILSRIVARSESLLPSEYSGSLDQVSPNSMGSARLQYDSEGRVPWDRIWTSFCDLAMAGGPPHRGRLLEAISAEQVAVDPEGYQRVVQELRRGIGLASGLPTVESSALGWVGVCCSDEAMAAWMLRAIVIENVMVRREGKVLYLPAGPHFRIEKEIKNVITTVAKTAHYWQAHLRTRQPPKPL